MAPFPMTRWLELVAWTAGILLLASYFALRALSAHARDEGVEAMHRARAENAAVASVSVPATAHDLSVADPDTSTWAAKRLAEYRKSLGHREVPDAVLRIPKLKLEVPVYEGTSETTLNRGAGRIAGTAEIESLAGNVGIAAHRDGFFRPLKDIAVGDAIFIDTVRATRQYRVTHLDIVDPSDVHVLADASGATVTLVTCYPFYFVGSAPKRFIVRARASGDALATREGVIPIVGQRNAQ
jgi:sortase A